MFNNEEVVSPFHLRIGISVSNDFDMKQLLVKLIKSITNENCSDLGIEQLQMHLWGICTMENSYLSCMVCGMRIRENGLSWGIFWWRVPNGSKILVTTCSLIVASIIRTISFYNLEVLLHEECLSLFIKWAFGEGEAR